MPPTFVIATRNPGKAEEFLEILAPLPVKWMLLSDFPALTLEVEETGATYAENARLKAEAYARATGHPVLADDSGLEVDALDGEPGVFTARYGGPGLTFPDRWKFILSRLNGLPAPDRTARFRCAIALAAPDLPTRFAEGTCEGQIALAPAGEGGFGYDPIFFLPSFGMTMAQLPAELKHQLSHRGQAARAALPLILASLERLNRELREHLHRTQVPG
jgi:XTP/dITP diphosphohydrolase